jgi:hypothetical protein
VSYNCDNPDVSRSASHLKTQAKTESSVNWLKHTCCSQAIKSGQLPSDYVTRGQATPRARILCGFRTRSHFSSVPANQIVIRSWRSNLSAIVCPVISEGLTIFNLPSSHRKRLRTSNMLERLNEEVRRRIKIIGSFPNRDTAPRVISFILMERNDEWGSRKKYVTFKWLCHRGAQFYRKDVARSEKLNA